MKLEGKKIGVAVTGSFCTFAPVMQQLQNLADAGADVTVVFSERAQKIDTRFGKSADFLKKAEEITGKPAILTIADAEQIGPRKLFDVLAIAPCTGNTVAKLANGITDTPVLMAAKAHLRNEKPLVIFLSTNDALGMNMKNIGILLNTKHIYFVPFGQDDPQNKKNSLVSHARLLIPATEAALEGRQIQPLLVPYGK